MMNNDVATDLLRRWRRMNNLTVRSASEMDQLHKETDQFLSDNFADTEPHDRWDNPRRVAHRNTVRNWQRDHYGRLR